MITPTKTVCYAYTKDPAVLGGMIKRRIDRVKDDRVVTAPGPGEVFYIGRKYSEIERIVVREEVIEQQRPQYPWCSKNLNPLNPCDCGDCDKVLAYYSKVKEARL